MATQSANKFGGATHLFVEDLGEGSVAFLLRSGTESAQLVDRSSMCRKGTATNKNEEASACVVKS